MTKRSSGGLRAAALPVGRDSGEALLHVLQSQGSSPPTITDPTCHPDFPHPSMKLISIFEVSD